MSRSDEPSDRGNDPQVTTWESGGISAEHIRRFGPGALIAVIALLFVAQNTDSVKFEFLWFDFEWPLWIMLVIFMAAGAAIFYFGVRKWRRRQALNDADE